MPALIDGRAIANTVEEEIEYKISELNKKSVQCKLAVVLVGDDEASRKYVKKKEQAAARVGIIFELHTLPADISKENIIQEIKAIQEDTDLSGLIVQLPLPEPLYTTEVLNAIKPEVDVDCLTDTNLGKLVMKTQYLFPPTPAAVLTILKELEVNLVGKNVTIIGVGALVGKPLSIMMMNERASVTTCNSATKDIREKCLQADIIVSGVGKKDVVRGDIVKEGAIVIDTGIAFENGKMYGDVNVEEVSQKAAYVTPTPGGVGPITVARLLWNTVLCAERNVN